MGIQRLKQESGGGTDWSKYKNSLSLISYDVNNNSTWVSLLNRTGKGYIKALYSSASTGTFNIRVTVDGVVLMTYRSYNTNIASGMATKDFIAVGGNNTSTDQAWMIGTQQSTSKSIIAPGYFYDLPVQNLDSEIFSLLSQPIFYNESLNIEAKTHSSIANGTACRASVYFFGGIGI